MAQSEFVLTVDIDQDVLERAIESAQQAVESGLLSEDQAETAAIDAVLADGLRIF